VQNALSSPQFRRRAFLTLGGVVLALAALWLASRIPRTLTVFVVAAFIAFGVAPVVAWLERHLARGLAIAIVYIGLVVSAIVLALLIVPATLAQIQNVGANAPAYIEVMQRWIDGVQNFMAEHVGKTYLPPGYGDLQGLIAGRISASFSTLLASLADILINTFTAAFIGISALVLSAFFLLRGVRIADPLYALLPAQRRATARALGIELANVFGAFVSGQVALCAITGSLIFAFTLVTGFKFALLLGIVAGIAYAVPFVGMIVAHAIGLVLAAPQGLQTVIWVQIIIFTIARVSDNLLVPKIMSESVGVSPIVVMFAVFAGGELFGLPGLLFGIPAAALAKVAWRFFRSRPPAEPEPPFPEVVMVAPVVAVVERS
jgi:predicted PurR-regulated permease PerM